MQDDSRENLGHPEFADQKIIPLPVPLQEKSFIYLLFHKVPYLHEIFGPLLPSAEPYGQQTLFGIKNIWGAEDPVLFCSIGLNILGTEDQLATI